MAIERAEPDPIMILGRFRGMKTGQTHPDGSKEAVGGADGV